MSANNPSITASDIINDVEARLDEPGIANSDYLPWVSYAYQKTYQALLNAGQRVKEELFGNVVTFNLTPGVNEYSLSGNIPRFGGFIKVEVKYGASGDTFEEAKRLRSIAHWRDFDNISTSYRGKTEVLYYLLEDILGFIPTPPASETTQTPQARVWYVRRPYQITVGTDVIDIDYRFIYPIVNYVHARAMERENEDYSVAQSIENKFERELIQLSEAANSEFDEGEPNTILVAADDELFQNPLRYN